MWARSILRRPVRPHRPMRSFSAAVQEAGGISSGVDRGTLTVATDQIVGSVSRWQNLRSDFLYRTGQAMTRRFVRIGQAMIEGKALPPIDLYKLSGAARSEYYVVDGHHRVAMARRLGQDFLDARVREFRPGVAREAQQAHTLRREAEILRTLQHPTVVGLLEVGEVAERLGGGTFIAMEWLPDALDRVLHARFPEPLELTQALRIGGAVAEALAAVHAAGLVHRDVKPSNILLRANGEPVLSDFGVAAVVEDVLSERRLTPPNVLTGTADYLAPEVISGDAADGRADVYALGIVLYEMLTGFVPFAGRDPTQMLRAHCEEPIPALPNTVPLPVREVVERALHKDPHERYATAGDLARALKDLP